MTQRQRVWLSYPDLLVNKDYLHVHVLSVLVQEVGEETGDRVIGDVTTNHYVPKTAATPYHLFHYRLRYSASMLAMNTAYRGDG